MTFEQAIGRATKNPGHDKACITRRVDTWCDCQWYETCCALERFSEKLKALEGLLDEAVREAAQNFEKLNDDPPVRLYFCMLCNAHEGSEASTWEGVKHTDECLVSRAAAALRSLRETEL